MPKLSNIDILCNDETSEDWVKADFNGDINPSNDDTNFKLFKSLSAYSSLHILNAKMTDFDKQTGEPNKEILEVLSWYNKLSNGTQIVIIIRDLKNISNHSTLVECLTKNYSKIDLLSVDNLFDHDADQTKLETLRHSFVETFIESVLKKMQKNQCIQYSTLRIFMKIYQKMKIIIHRK
jgi:hypothetical protein